MTQLPGVNVPTDDVRHDLGQPALALAGVSVYYYDTPALEDISFQLGRGERVAVIGPNGAGKSTLFNVIAGVVRPTRGRVNIYGSSPEVHVCIAYVPQRSQVDWQFPANVAEAVMMGRVGKIGLFRRAKRRDWERVYEALNLVGLAHLAKRQLGALSGGQQQRVFIARALAQEAELMLMDEPFSGLDVTSQEDLFAILEMLRQRQVTVMVATHDLNQAIERFDRLLLLKQRLIGFGPPGEVFRAPLLSQAYGGYAHVMAPPQLPISQTNGSRVSGHG